MVVDNMSRLVEAIPNDHKIFKCIEPLSFLGLDVLGQFLEMGGCILITINFVPF